MRLPTNDFGPTVVVPPAHQQESRLQWLLRTVRDTANPNTMHTEDLTPVELERQASFESLDYYKPYPDMYVEYLRENYKSRRHRYVVSSPNDLESSETLGSATRRRRSNNGGVRTPTLSSSLPNVLPAGANHEGNGSSTAVDNNASVSLSLTTNDAASPLDHVTDAFPMLQMDLEERHAALRWSLHVLIALSVGVVATFVSYAVDFVETYRADVLYRVMTDPHAHVGVRSGMGFLYTVVGSVLLAAVAAGVVVYFEPAAAGGGIPDVMAYLNGVHLRKAMNLRTFVAKTVSCICAVSGGLPVGLEAPLIHLGAITGAGVTQGRSRTLGFQTTLFQPFRNNKDRRDFITAGAACGVSVAFGAPIGGLLFVMEEVSSFWNQSSNGQIFLATMLCFTFSTIINSIVEDRRLLGWVSNAASVLFEVNLTIPLNLVSIVPSLFLGLIIGSMAAFFTKVNLMHIKWRRRVLRPYPFRRFLEPVVVAAVFSALMYVMSLASPCAEVQAITDVNASVHVWGTESAGRLFNNTCRKPGTYSPLGTLSMASGKNTIRHLFSRQTAGEFSIANLLLYFFIYFGSAVISSGTAVAGGLVVPSLVMGAVFGRLYGLLLFKLGTTSIPGLPNSYAASEAWMDPGVFALVGAGAFLAGTSRMTMAICVIMVELSSELHYLLPVMVAIVMSKSTADWLCEPLYHQMLHMDNVPYLPYNIVRPEFEQLTAADVMANEVVVLRVRERTELVLAALRDSTHHAFPVVEAELDLEADGGEEEDPSPSPPKSTSKNTGRGTENPLGNGIHSGSGTWRNGDSPLTLSGTRSANSSSTAGPGPGAAARSSPSSAHSHHPSLEVPTTATAHIRFKFVGLVTREDLQVYFTLPQLQEYDCATATPSPTRPPVPLSAEDSDGFGGRLAPCVLAIRRLTWQQWMKQKSRLFFATTDRYEWVRNHIPDGAPSGVDVGAENGSFISENRLPPVVDLSVIVNRSPWVIPPFFNLQMAYHTFRMMGTRHMVVVDGDSVAGMITRKDLLVDSLRRRMQELSARLALGDSAAPSLPPSHTNRNPTPRPQVPPVGQRGTRNTPDASAATGTAHTNPRTTALAAAQLESATTTTTTGEPTPADVALPLSHSARSARVDGKESNSTVVNRGTPRYGAVEDLTLTSVAGGGVLPSPLSSLFGGSASAVPSAPPRAAVATGQEATASAASLSQTHPPPPLTSAGHARVATAASSPVPLESSTAPATVAVHPLAEAAASASTASLPASAGPATVRVPVSPGAGTLFDLSLVGSAHEAEA